MRQHTNNNNTRRPASGGRHQSSPHNNNNNNNGRYRRTNAQTRTNAIYDRDEMSDIVTPQQSRHATNQQTKFLDLAKNAKQQGDRVEMEYYMQHVEHYTRILNLAEAQEAVRLQERQARHQPRVQQQQVEDSEDEEVLEVAEGVELTPEEEAERQARMERNRARRRHRRQRRSSYGERGEQQAGQGGESEQAEGEAAAPISQAHIVPSVSSEERATPAQGEKAPRTTRPYKRRSVAQPDMLENSGAALQDILPAARLDT